MRTFVSSAIIGVALWGCSEQCYPEARYWNYTQYPTPAGPLAAEDRATLEKVAECLKPLREHWLSPAEQAEAQCVGIPVFEVRSCVKVAVAPDWHVSQCTGEQVFPCAVPTESCRMKGQDGGCPCSCRAMIQDNTTIWVTPNRKLLPAYAVTLLTGCNNPWTISLAKCSMPPL
jgi:hypothetical protein